MGYDLHPIVAQQSPSGEQTPAVVTRGCDVVLAAGAGAGKTRTLVARYLSLLADGLSLRSIVAITFTKKAAREMRNRVREEVRRYLTGEELSPGERRRWNEIYQELDAARIGTIHSLCAEILRHHPVEASSSGFIVDPRFEMLDEGQMGLLQADAVDAALAWAADDPETVQLFSDVGERELRTTVARLLSRRLDVAPAAGLAMDLWELWRPLLVGPLRAFVDDGEVAGCFADLSALRSDGSLERAAAAGDALVPNLRAALVHWDAIATARRQSDWGELSRHLAPLRDNLRQKGTKRNWAPADPKPAIRALQARYDELVKPLVGKGIDLDLDRRIAQEVGPALLRVFDRALEVYTARKQLRRALDFDDLEAMALALVGTHAEVRAYWQSQVQALLVDEFQDTNGRQRDLVKALNGDSGKLFIVGDGKQSIYRFRGADVSVFREERAAMAQRGRSLSLTTSYRAHAALVDLLNGLLRPVLGQCPDPRRPYVEPFAPLLAHRTEPAAGIHSPYVELHLAVGPKQDGALDRAARILATRLTDLVGSGAISIEDRDEETDRRQVRDLNYGDIAVLCRASGSFEVYEDAFEAARIPYLTIAGRGFYDRPEVRDLLNALRALADPMDDLALAGLLRSPVIGLTDMSLYRLRDVEKSRCLTSIWQVLQEGALDFLEEDADRAAAARDLISRLRGQVGRVPVAVLLKAYLDATSYRAALLYAGQARAARNVAKLLADAHASGIVGIDTFVAYIAELRDVASREGEARALAEGAVQIMSVHQAKGLEFPVVVIGDASRTGGRRGGVFIDPELGVVPRLHVEAVASGSEGEGQSVSSAAYRLAQTREADQSAAESARLLYVAATRAQELLLVSGAVGVTKRGGINPRGWLADLVGAIGLKERVGEIDPEGAQYHDVTCEIEGRSVLCVIAEPGAPLGTVTGSEPTTSAEDAVLPNLALLAPLAVAVSEPDPNAEETERDPPRRVWRVVPRDDRPRAPAWVVGKIVHAALGLWLFPEIDGKAASIEPVGDAAADLERRGFYAAARGEALACGLTSEVQVVDAVRRAARMLASFRPSKLCAEIATADRRFHEMPYSVLGDDGRVDSGVVDVLYETDAGWTLVEFKTDDIRDDSALRLRLAQTDYTAQVERYRVAAERLLGAAVQPIICLLNYRGRTRVLRSW